MIWAAGNRFLALIVAFLGGGAVFCGDRDTLLSLLVAMVIVLLIRGGAK